MIWIDGGNRADGLLEECLLIAVGRGNYCLVMPRYCVLDSSFASGVMRTNPIELNSSHMTWTIFDWQDLISSHKPIWLPYAEHIPVVGCHQMSAGITPEKHTPVWDGLYIINCSFER